jgi:hypothetical protein
MGQAPVAAMADGDEITPPRAAHDSDEDSEPAEDAAGHSATLALRDADAGLCAADVCEADIRAALSKFLREADLTTVKMRDLRPRVAVELGLESDGLDGRKAELQALAVAGGPNGRYVVCRC